MPEQDGDRKALILGMIAAGVPAAAAISQVHDHPSLKDVPSVNSGRFSSMARPGDIVVSSGKEPYSGWRAITRPMNLSPYYHAELVHLNKGKKVRGMVGWGTTGEPMRYHAGNTPESSVLLRPKVPLSDVEKRRLFHAVKKVFGADYGELKMPVMGLQRFLTPKVPGAENLSSICAGDVCSTGPASVYRQLGRKGMKGVPTGTELAGDFLRSKDFTPIAVHGMRYDIPARIKSLMAARLGFAAAAGLGTYALTKDVSSGNIEAPLGGLAGALGAGALGTQLESNIETYPNYLRSKIRAAYKKTPNIPGKSALKSMLMSIIKFKEKFPMWLPLMGAAGGGALGYTIGKTFHDKDKQAASVLRP